MKTPLPSDDACDCAGLTLTPRQHQILRFLADYRSNNGYSPTLQEMAQALRLSRVTVFEHVEALVRKGLLIRRPNKARSLTLNPDFDWPAITAGPLKSVPPAASLAAVPPDEAGLFPFLGQIAAGCPLEAVENPDQLDLKTLFETQGDTFALQVSGESMIDDHIQSGDYVLVKKTNRAQDGQRVVALMENGQATLKKIFRQGSGYLLVGANADFEPLYVNALQIQGVVIGLVRRY
ncbi:MAG: repressor LexA [Sedimentisphaerales bacterium]|nr:repressor LexA [Sedimentisphaerales bacterium]